MRLRARPDAGSEPVEALALARDRGGDRTDAENRSDVVDMLRAVAALMVVVAHSSLVAMGGAGDDVVNPLREMLGAGVLLFFSLSGYLLAGPYLRALAGGQPLPRASAFLLRRAARIYPAYWIALACVLLFLMPVNGVKPWQVPVHALLLHSSWPVPGEVTAIYFVAWTLGIEAVFYLLVPIAANILRAVHPRPWTPRSLAALVLVAWLATAAWHTQAHVLGVGSHLALALQIGIGVWLYAFCPGMLIAIAAFARPSPRVASLLRTLAHPVVLLGVIALWMTLAIARTRYGVALDGWLTPVYSVFCGLIVNLAFNAGSWIRRPARWLAPIGLISYGIYLWHYIVISMMRRHGDVGFHGGIAAWMADVVLVLAITLPIAAVSWFRVEKPLMRRAADWARRRRPAAVRETATA